MKVPLTISIEQEELNVIRHFCEVAGYPISRLYDEHTKAIYRTIKASGLDKKTRYSKLELLKMVVKGSMHST